MAALAATSSATTSLQSLLLQRRVLQARREADQAEANAENLRQQADEQDRVVQQARQRVQGLEKQSSAASSTTQASSSQTTTPTQSTPTYAQELASVFYLAKPILATDLSAPQKNIVKDSLFEAAEKKWAANPSPSTAIQNYSLQVVDSPSKTMGRLLNTTV